MSKLKEAAEDASEATGAFKVLESILEQVNAPFAQLDALLGKVNGSIGKLTSGTDQSSKQLKKNLGVIGDVLEGVYGKKSAKVFRHFASGSATAVDATKVGKAAMHSLGDAMGVLSSASDVAKDALMSVAGAAASAVLEGGKLALHGALFREATVNSFKNLEGGAAQAERTWGFAKSIANKLGASTGDVAGQIDHLMRAGFKAGDAEVLTQAAADVAGANGGNKASGDQFLAIIEKAKKGGVTTDIAAQLRELGIGKKSLDLAKLKGLDPTHTILSAMMTQFGESKVGDTAAKFFDTTLQGSLDKVQNRFDNLWKGLKSGDAANVLISALQKIASAMDPTTAEGKELTATLDHAAGVVAKLFAEIDVGKAIEGFEQMVAVVDNLLDPLEALGKGIFEGLGDSLAPLFKLLSGIGGKTAGANDLAATLGKIGKAIGWLAGGVVDATAAAFALMYGPIALVTAVAVVLVDQFDNIKAALGRAANFIAGAASNAFVAFVDKSNAAIMFLVTQAAALGVSIYDAIGEAIEAVAGAAASMYNAAVDIGTSMVNGIFNGLTSGWGKLLTWLSDKSTELGRTVKDALGIHSPSKVFAQLGSYTALGFQEGIAGGMPDVQDAMRAMAVPPPELGNGSSGGKGGAGAGGRGGNTFHVEIGGIHVSGSAGSPEEIKQAVTVAISDIFEQLSVEMGVAVA